METHTIERHWHRVAACAAALCAAGVYAASGADASTQNQAQARYQSDVQACKSGRTAQDTETCLTEARNARAARQKGHLATDTRQFEANKMRRCEVFEGEARAACVARLSGHGKTTGSVAGGGILREVETIVVKPDAGPVRITPKTDDPVILVPRKP